MGRGLLSLFPEAVAYDEPLGMGIRGEVNDRDFAFVCVPTPGNPDGSCDTSIVEDAVGWIEAGTIIIRSTVPPGTTAKLIADLNKHIVFQPEYGPGETPDHPFHDMRNIRWAILGGFREDTNRVAALYQTVFNSEIQIVQTHPTTAELCKYMENAYYATKVTFCNEFFDIAQAMGVDYNELRELWLMDPRVGRSHTFVFPEDRGFGGKCLPKDLAAILHEADRRGLSPTMLRAVEESNNARPVALTQQVSG